MSNLAGPLLFPLGGDASNVFPKTTFNNVVGADVVMARNPNTGKFTLQWDPSGNPVFGDDQSHAVLSLIYEYRGQYSRDPSGNRGSYLFTLKEIRKATPSKAKAYIEDALQPLVDAGKIIPPKNSALVTVSRDAFNVNRLNVLINYTTPGGLNVTLRPSLGY